MATNFWLMKAEPDSRIVKGKDVKFSVDDFEAIKTTPWEGVRNAEARNLMKQMHIGDKVLFYHSNCKLPGIAAFAEVSKEAYPDYTAWDTQHPYYDAKTDKDNPKWFMVDVTFTSRLPHFIPLSFLKRIADVPDGEDPPDQVAYILQQGVKEIKEMPLIKRGRLSVQKVSQGVWPVIQSLAERGGWEDIPNTNGTGKGKGKEKTKATSSKRNTTTTRNQEEEEEEGDSDNREDRPSRRGPSKRKKERGVSEEKGSEEDEDGDLVQGRKKLKGSRLGTPDQAEGGGTTTARRSARLKR